MTPARARTLWRRGALTLAAIAVYSAFAPNTASARLLASADTVWVSPLGSDGNRGSASDPVLTLQRAEQVLRANDRDCDAHVLIASDDGAFMDQTVDWDYYRPNRSIVFESFPDSANACFLASDENPPAVPFFTLRAVPGEPTRLIFRRITVRNYVTRAFYFLGDWSDENHWNGENRLEDCCFQDIGNERMPEREIVYGVVTLVNSRRNTIVDCRFIDCANSNNTTTAIERDPDAETFADSFGSAAGAVLPIIGIYIAHMSSDNVVVGCSMLRIKGDAVRLRDQSNRNRIQYCTFHQVGWNAVCSSWFCDNTLNNCIKPSLECHCLDNQLLDNRSEGGWYCAEMAIFRDLMDRNLVGCGNESLARRITILGNVTGPCEAGPDSKRDIIKGE
jgi:hypothetical protein